MTEKRWQTAKQAQQERWHSKRHESREAQDEAKAEYHLLHGREARQRRAKEREEKREQSGG